MKIITGGQTGVDRAALDAALKSGVDCGGWCPAGREGEFGRIPDRYPVRELEQGGFAERTLANVRDSQGTVAIYQGELAGGTRYTVDCCVELGRPHLLIDAARLAPEVAAELISKFAVEHKVDVLNVAGPRESEWPEGYGYAFRLMELFLAML